MSKIDDARKSITEIDKQMAELFEKRMVAAKDVAFYKKEFGLPIEDSLRENELIKRNSAYIKDETIREFYITYLKNMFDVSKKYQYRLINNLKVAYSGTAGAFAENAAHYLFKDANYIAYGDFSLAYEAVEKGECDVAVLPVENSFAGDVGAVMDLIFSGSLYINQMLDYEIVHNLVAKRGASKDSIKVVYSHPQALSQCGKYLTDNNYTAIEASNTAVAAKMVSESNDYSIAAIASKETAELYNLEIVESNINSKRNNTTRFAVFSRLQNTPSANIKMGEHFILVFTVVNEAGALAKTLNIIGAHNFNMRNLRSRPMKELMWNYYFFVELEGNINSSDGRDMLKELSTVCDRLKLVGTYYSLPEK